MNTRAKILNKSTSEVLTDYTLSLMGSCITGPKDIPKTELDLLDQKGVSEMQQAISEGVCNFWIELFKDYFGLNSEEIAMDMAVGLKYAAEERKTSQIIKSKNTPNDIVKLLFTTDIMQNKLDLFLEMLDKEER